MVAYFDYHSLSRYLFLFCNLLKLNYMLQPSEFLRTIWICEPPKGALEVHHVESAMKLYAEHVKKEYEEKNKWFPIYEPPRTAELVIVDSDNDLHACVAVAFFENEIWKYANGQTLWFNPRRWRRFL